jgi:hypothetical protein
MAFPSPTGPNSYIWNLKQVYVARMGNNWPDSLFSRGIYGGGGFQNVIQYIDTNSLGNATDFGDLTLAVAGVSAATNSTHMLFNGGYLAPSYVRQTAISRITIASTGNAVSFGNLSAASAYCATANNATIGLYAGTAGGGPGQNQIQRITLSSGGTVQTGANLTFSRWGQASSSSTTRAVFGGGQNNDSFPTNNNLFNNTIDYVDYASDGTCSDFGDLSVGRNYPQGVASQTRMVIGGGGAAPYPGVDSNVIDYITFASTGNATDFGDLTVATGQAGFTGMSNSLRGIFAGQGATNVMQYITIATLGNSIDFGDLIVATAQGAAGCNKQSGL